MSQFYCGKALRLWIVPSPVQPLNLCWTLNGIMFVFDLICNIILLLSLVVTFNALMLKGLAIWTWLWFRFLTIRDWNLFSYFCCSMWICRSILLLNVILYCLHMCFLHQRSSSMCFWIRVREVHKSLHFLKLNFAAPDKGVFSI